ncbi:MAG: ShlB/FhaC/HecB family hemolysin secretion/activation protein [Brachymonas sp.]|nr:ShlB/FhaC/HecB family hemolysin secretion/activation protein [Brachymonas sp.]
MELFSQTKLRHTLTVSLLAAGCISAWAQSFVPAEIGAEQEQRRTLERQQQLQQQQQNELERRQRQAVQALEAQVDAQAQAPAVDLGRLPLPEDERPCFPIQQVDITGMEGTQVPSALWRGLPQALARYQDPSTGRFVLDAPQGRCLGAQGINILLARAQNHLIGRGYITSRVLAPVQDLKTGQLSLNVIPGRVAAVQAVVPKGTQAEGGHVAIDAGGADASASIAPQTAQQEARQQQALPLRIQTALPMRPGDLLNLRDIEQGLENLKRVPTADADIQIAPADQAGPTGMGQSNLIVQHSQQRPVRLNVSLDDSGTDNTGKYQATATLSLDNPLRLNDLFYLSYSRALGGGQPQADGRRGSDAYQLHYSIPYGYWLLSMGASKNSYRQTVAGAVQNYLYSGHSQSAEVALGRVVHRNASSKTTFTLKGWARNSRNFIDDVEVDVQRRRTAGWQAQLHHRQYIGTASLDGTLAYKRGTGALGAQPAPEDLFGEGTSRFALATADLSIHAPFTLGGQKLRWSSQWRWQHSFTRLTVQDQFGIGGRYSVRGFDGESSLLAERGWFTRNELGWALGASGQEAYLGLDHGRVSGPGSQHLLGKSLTGAVAGLRGQGKGWARGLSYDVFVGAPVHKPNNFRTAKHAAGFHMNWSF